MKLLNTIPTRRRKVRSVELASARGNEGESLNSPT